LPGAAALAVALFAGALAAGAQQERGQEPPPVGLGDLAELPTRTPQLLSRSPSTVSVVTGEELRDSGVRFFPDALRGVPGLEIQRFSSSESNVAARSFSNDSSSAQGMLGLVDGRQVYNDFLGSVLWETLPVSLDEIEKVEVIRGPGSFVHGPNAMHGLVNVVTRRPLQYGEGHTSISGSYGSYRSNTETAIHVRRSGHAALKAKIGHDDIDEFEPAGKNAKDKGFLELRYEALLSGEPGAAKEDHVLDLTGGLHQQKFNLLIPTFAGVPSREFANELREYYVKAQYSLGNFKALFFATHFLGRAEPESIYTPFDVRVDSADLDLQHTIAPFEGHTVTGGTGYRVAAAETEDQDVSRGRHKMGLGWVFLQDQVRLAETFTFTGGLRLDWHSVTGTATSPRFAAVWEVDEGHFLRGTAGYGFRNPSMRELWFEMPINVPGLPVPATLAGNDDLVAEKIRSFELGYRWRKPRAPTKAEAIVYYNLIDRLVEFQPVEFFPSPPFPPGTPSRLAPQNANKDEAYGVELELEHEFGPDVSAFANYSFGIRRDRDTRDRNTEAPRHKASGGVRLRPAEGWRAALWAAVFDDIEAFDAPGTGTLDLRVDEYALLNARVSYELAWGEHRGTVFLQAFNLLDHDHREHPEGDSYGLILTGGAEIRW
jgi:iron complex outermembrane receptor protein